MDIQENLQIAYMNRAEIAMQFDDEGVPKLLKSVQRKYKERQRFGEYAAVVDVIAMKQNVPSNFNEKTRQLDKLLLLDMDNEMEFLYAHNFKSNGMSSKKLLDIFATAEGRAILNAPCYFLSVKDCLSGCVDDKTWKAYMEHNEALSCLVDTLAKRFFTTNVYDGTNWKPDTQFELNLYGLVAEIELLVGSDRTEREIRTAKETKM